MPVLYVVVGILLALITFTVCQVSVVRCNGAWFKQDQCLRDNTAKAARADPTFPVPVLPTQNRIKRDIDNCFKQDNCQSSPAPSVQETSARRDCFNAAVKRVIKEMKKCVEKTVRGWRPVDGYPKVNVLQEWVYTFTCIKDVLRNPVRYCADGSRRRALQQCARNAGFNWNHRPPGSLPSYWCDQDAMCWFDVGATCQGEWDRTVQPALCKCSNTPNLEHTTREEYRQCIKQRIKTQLNADDPGQNWITDYLHSLCIKENNNPCRRQRRNYQRAHG